jgi:hypothetical protein
MTQVNLSQLTNEELNTRTALHVMGWELKGEYYIDIDNAVLLHAVKADTSFAEHWNPAENHADAFTLAKAIMERGVDFDLVYHEFNEMKDGQGWAARFPFGLEKPGTQEQVWGPTATIAICRAALFVTYMD